MAWRLRGSRLPLAWALVVVLALIGVGSFLFHTHAQTWSALADTGAIGVFILIYLYAASRDYLGLSWIYARAQRAGLFPVRSTSGPAFARPAGAGRLGRLPAGGDPDRALCGDPCTPRARHGKGPRHRGGDPSGLAHRAQP
jgi:hypothetical protein